MMSRSRPYKLFDSTNPSGKNEAHLLSFVQKLAWDIVRNLRDPLVNSLVPFRSISITRFDSLCLFSFLVKYGFQFRLKTYTYTP